MITSQMYDVQDTGQFRSDLKLAKKQGLDLALLGEIVDCSVVVSLCLPSIVIILCKAVSKVQESVISLLTGC